VSKATSKTEQNNSVIGNLTGVNRYDTTISDGKDSVTRTGNTPQESQERASDSWAKKGK